MNSGESVARAVALATVFEVPIPRLTPPMPLAGDGPGPFASHDGVGDEAGPKAVRGVNGRIEIRPVVRPVDCPLEKHVHRRRVHRSRPHWFPVDTARKTGAIVDMRPIVAKVAFSHGAANSGTRLTRPSAT